MKLVQPIRKVAQIKRMKEIAAARPRDICLLEMGFHTGLRVQDILSLHISDIARINNGRWQAARSYVVNEQKTRKGKQVELVKSVRTAIEKQIETLDACGMAAPQGWLFPSPYRQGDKPLSRRHAGRLIKSIARRAGVTEPVACHSLRKSFGYHAFRAGVDIMYLKEIFNHSDIGITKRYIGITQDELNSVYQRLGAIMA
ncbi:MAG: tyrosine-type recombinase/integrase [Synergistaceae bacterium]|nr:tyrosine-type recombinase/integrase [Synergistaceae bacterium]